MSTDSTNDDRDPQLESTSESAETPTATDQFRTRSAALRESAVEDGKEERSMWSGTYAGKAMVGIWIIMGLVTIGLLVLPFFVEQISFLMVAIVILLMWIIGGLRYASRRYGHHYELTNHRFIHQTGLISRRTDRMEVIDIDDVSFRQGPMERVFGVGTVVLTSTDRSHPHLEMPGIANVKEVSSLIDDVRLTERRQRKLHITSH